MVSDRKPGRFYDGYIFDADGTVYLGSKLLPGAAQVVETLRDRGARVAFVSNNPTYTREQIAEKLTRLGVSTSPQHVINSTFVLVQYLLSVAPAATVYPIAEKPVHNELIAAGFSISEDPSKIDYVIASFDRTFVYHKLQVGFDAIRAGAHFIATNADPYCPVENGAQPDAGAIIGALQASTGVQVEQIVGKPSAIMARTALSVVGVPPRDCLLIGDRLHVDIVMAKKVNMSSALVLTGATQRTELDESTIVPDFVLERLTMLLP
jgi:NagD protein